jgi:acyl phosphate:glycerol-3-phosphate acyltransferase
MVASLAIVSVVAAVAAYLLGSIPTGPLLAQARGVDLRSVGSGNIGAANATRALGKALGIATFVGDALKGLLPTLVARLLNFPTEAVAIVGFAAFFGHLYPIYLRFRGGKGVATAAGIFFAMAPIATLIALGVWILLFLPWRIVSVASLAAALAFPVALVALGGPLPYLICACAVLAFILYKHRGNIERLLHRSERKV